MDEVKEDTQRTGVTEEVRVGIEMIYCSDL